MSSRVSSSIFGGSLTPAPRNNSDRASGQITSTSWRLSFKRRSVRSRTDWSSKLIGLDRCAKSLRSFRRRWRLFRVFELMHAVRWQRSILVAILPISAFAPSRRLSCFSSHFNRRTESICFNMSSLIADATITLPRTLSLRRSVHISANFFTNGSSIAVVSILLPN